DGREYSSKHWHLPRSAERTGRCAPAGPFALERPHPDVAELDQVVVAVVLQAGEALRELSPVGRWVTGPGRLLAGRVVELVDHHTVADDREVLSDRLDLVVVPRALRRDPGVRQVDRVEVVHRPRLLWLAARAVVDLDLVSTVDRHPRLRGGRGPG